MYLHLCGKDVKGVFRFALSKEIHLHNHRVALTEIHLSKIKKIYYEKIQLTVETRETLINNITTVRELNTTPLTLEEIKNSTGEIVIRLEIDGSENLVLHPYRDGIRVESLNYDIPKLHKDQRYTIKQNEVKTMIFNFKVYIDEVISTKNTKFDSYEIDPEDLENSLNSIPECRFSNNILSIQENQTFHLSKPLQNYWGLESNVLEPGVHTLELKDLTKSLLVLSDIVSSQLYNEMFQPLLRNIDKQEGTLVFVKPYYFGLSIDRFQNLEISIKTNNNLAVEFEEEARFVLCFVK